MIRDGWCLLGILIYMNRPGVRTGNWLAVGACDHFAKEARGTDWLVVGGWWRTTFRRRGTGCGLVGGWWLVANNIALKRPGVRIVRGLMVLRI